MPPHTLLVEIFRNVLPDQLFDNYTPCIKTLSQTISKDIFVYCMRVAGEQELRFHGTFTTNIYKCLKRHIEQNVLNLSLLATIYISGRVGMRQQFNCYTSFWYKFVSFNKRTIVQMTLHSYEHCIGCRSIEMSGSS